MECEKLKLEEKKLVLFHAGFPGMEILFILIIDAGRLRMSIIRGWIVATKFQTVATETLVLPPLNEALGMLQFSQFERTLIFS